MNLSDFSIKSPYTVIAVSLLIAAVGAFAFFRTPTDLFPDTVPPQVVVVTVWPGADADDIADKVTQVIEKELNTLSGLKRVTSTSRDEVSSINAEFYYDKDLGEAVLDVQNAVSRIRASLPSAILEPRIYRISDATRPLLTLSLTPKPESAKDLSQIRLLAENQIEDELLNVPGVADVDVFGAHKPEIKIRVSREQLAANNLMLGEVLAALARHNVSAPAGTVYSPNREYLLKVSGEFANLDQIRRTPIRFIEGGVLRLRDVARVELGESEQRSVYHGNGKPAIAINVLRPEHGPTVEAIRNIKNKLPKLGAEYPDIDFTITDDQQPIIDLNVTGMRSSLLQAVLLTIAVIFLFLADLRAALVVSISIPMAFLASLVVLWFSPYTLNMVTLSGMIIAVGMVVDASIVVLENIYRHYREDEDKNPVRAASVGAREVTLAITAGMLTTVIVLIPVMFAGGYTQQTMRPLNLIISATLVGSLLAALTIVPLMASRLLAHGKRKRSFIERIFSVTDRGVDRLGRFYLGLLRGALRHRWVVLILAGVFLVLTMKQVKPLIGGELMPPMDTGIVNLDFETPSDYTPRQVENTLSEIEAMVYETPGVLTISSVVGSEPGEISFGGAGATAQSGQVKITLVDRTQRKDDIWKIQDQWREKLRKIPGVQDFTIAEYGATPLSTTRAPLDLIVSGPDPRVLDELAGKAILALDGTPGLVDVRRSWRIDKRDCRIQIDPDLAELYHLSPPSIATELRTAVKGVAATPMRLSGYLDIPITVQYQGADIEFPSQLRDVYLDTPMGQVPLRSLAQIHPHRTQPFVTREELLPTIDITAVNRGYTIGQVTGMVKNKLTGLKTPAGYSIQIAGTAVDMKVGQQEMGRALMIGFVLLFILLVAMFKSFLHPFTIMAAIPPAVAGGFWGLLLFDKPMCKPAMMGMILLGGTIVNNSILLLDFIINARASGMARDEAILQSVRLRLRPILMTTVSTIIGLTPLIFEMAVGLERMSPLGIVAASGLLVGTFLTMIVIPVVYSIMDGLSGTAAQLSHRLWRTYSQQSYDRKENFSQMNHSQAQPVWRGSVSSAFLAGLLITTIVGCGGGDSGSAQPQMKAPLVTVEPVTSGGITRSLDLTAEVVPVESIQISSTVEGPIGYLPWREGDRVEAGQKLIEINREMYRAEVKAAEAALAVAQAKLDDLKAGTRPEEIEKARQSVREAEESAEFEKSDLERIMQLVESGALPGEEIEKARVRQTAAESKLNAARKHLEMLESGFTPTAIGIQEAAVKEAAAKLELAQARLNECIITAPFTGTITKVFVRKGDMAAMRTPLLEMADLSSLVVRCAVPETSSSEVRQGMKAQVRLDALPDKVLPAEIVRVYPELDPRMRTRTIELTVQEPVALVPGMFGRVRLIIESVPDAVTVPVQAVIVTPAGLQVAFVAIEGKAAQRKVETGIEEGGRIQILSGLTPGEKVIVSGQEKLKDGAEIRLPGPPKGDKSGQEMPAEESQKSQSGTQ
mgnify:FL=1